MKTNITIFFFLFFIFINSQITVKISYETVYQPNKINYNGFKIPEAQKEEIEKHVTQENKQPRKFVLYYENGNSFFQNDPSENLPSTKQKTEYYRLKNKNGIYRLSDYLVEEFYGYYPMNNVDIEFTNETQTIENYNCKLALYKNGNNISKVWYTEDIPISAGPYNYYKVPGLILKVENSKLTCYAVNVSKNVNKNDIKKMNPELKVYEGDELEKKNEEGKEKMLGNSRQRAEEIMKSLQKN